MKSGTDHANMMSILWELFGSELNVRRQYHIRQLSCSCRCFEIRTFLSERMGLLVPKRKFSGIVSPGQLRFPPSPVDNQDLIATGTSGTTGTTLSLQDVEAYSSKRASMSRIMHRRFRQCRPLREMRDLATRPHIFRVIVHSDRV